MQTICTSLQTDNHTNTPSLNFYRPDALSDAKPTVSKHRRHIVTLLLIIVAQSLVVALQRAEMRMVRWMCGVKLKDRLASKELRERLGIDGIALVLQLNRLLWYGHVLRKDDDDWVKKCIEYEVQGPRPRGRPKGTWTEVVREDCQARKMNKENAMDRCKCSKMIKDVR